MESEYPIINLPPVSVKEYQKPGSGGIEAGKYKRERQQKLLEVYTQTLDLPKACRRAGIDWGTHEGWIASDTAYRRALKIADKMVGRIVEAGEIHRAVYGVEKPVFFEGEQCGVVVEHDPRRAQTILRAKLPDEYGAKLEISVKDLPKANLDAEIAALMSEAEIVDAEFSVSDEDTPQGQDTPTPPAAGSPPPPQEIPPS